MARLPGSLIKGGIRMIYSKKTPDSTFIFKCKTCDQLISIKGSEEILNATMAVDMIRAAGWESDPDDDQPRCIKCSKLRQLSIAGLLHGNFADVLGAEV
jgi:hypothetical protein